MNLEAHQPLEGFSNRPCRRCRRAAIRARSRPEQIYVTKVPRQKIADAFSASLPDLPLHTAKSKTHVAIDRNRKSLMPCSFRRTPCKVGQKTRWQSESKSFGQSCVSQPRSDLLAQVCASSAEGSCRESLTFSKLSTSNRCDLRRNPMHPRFRPTSAKLQCRRRFKNAKIRKWRIQSAEIQSANSECQIQIARLLPIKTYACHSSTCGRSSSEPKPINCNSLSVG